LKATRVLVGLGLVALSALLGGRGPSAAQPAPSGARTYRVIVHPSNTATAVDRRFLAQAFLKKITQWPDGETIRPVDLQRDSSIRGQFTDDILARSTAAVRSYWQQMIFAGRGVPPPELGSDDEVVRFVLRQPGSVGYVSASADLRGAHLLGVN
jgi:ABC-type phosphate transport system substrate-binding protein